PQMFALPRTSRLGVNVQRARAALPVLARGFAGHPWFSATSKVPAPTGGGRGHRSVGFTLLELLIVVGIIGLLLVLIAPAFTYIKGGTDVTSAAYTIKGVLDTARTYAKANNTYTWVGFLEENVANPVSPNPDAPAIGRLVMSIVASKDGTTVYDPNNLAKINTTKLIQVGKLTKIENVHLSTFTDGSGAGLSFDTWPPVTYDTGRIGDTIAMNPSLTLFKSPLGSLD